MATEQVQPVTAPEMPGETPSETPYIQRKVPAYPSTETAEPAAMADYRAAETETQPLPATTISPAAEMPAMSAPALPVSTFESAANSDPTPIGAQGQPDPVSYVAEKVVEITPPPATVPVGPAAIEPIELPPGLELVETDPAKVRAAASAFDSPPPPRPPRVRPAPPPVSNDPLEQVETAK